jgi:hypothetical protein
LKKAEDQARFDKEQAKSIRKAALIKMLKALIKFLENNLNAPLRQW